jgi:hypothetical protein
MKNANKPLFYLINENQKFRNKDIYRFYFAKDKNDYQYSIIGKF